MARYLTVAEVVALHESIMMLTGSRPESLRDEGLLGSATMRPRTAAHYEGADLVRQAALLAIGISQNQPFVDGNKRTAFLSMITFLGLNNLAFEGDHDELARRLEGVAERSGSLSEATDSFVEWLNQHVVPRQ